MTAILDTRRSKYAAAIAVLLSTAATTSTSAFQTRASFVVSSRHSPLEANTRLATSLSTPTGTNVTAFKDDDDDQRKTRPQNSIHIDHLPHPEHKDYDNGRDPNFNEFHSYLHRISSNVKNPKTRANLMDDELKRLEAKYYDLSGDDVPECRYEPSKFSYAGPRFQPDEKCYAMVINAYAKSGLGKIGALLAEATAERFEHYHPGKQVNAFIMRGIVRSWVDADDLKRAEQWLNKMEERYDETREPKDAPDTATYNFFLNALVHSKYKKQAGGLSMTILEKMRNGYLKRGNQQVMPTLPTYLTVIRCQQFSRREGMANVLRMRKILQLLEQDYEAFGRPDSCKPTAEASLPIIEVATKFRGNIQSIMIAEDVLRVLHERYEETKDPEYLPIDQMYTLLFAAYSKVNSQYAARCSEKVDEVLKIMEKNGMDPSIFAVTAAIRAKVNDRSDESLGQSEEMLKSVDSPDAMLYQSMIKGYCRNGNAEKAYEMLQKLEESFDADVLSMGMCIDAIAKTTDDSYDIAIERSERLLEKIIHHYRNGLVRPNEAHVDSWIFEDVARLWTQSRTPGAGEKVLALIEKMEELHKVVPGYFGPTEGLYILALDAISLTERNSGPKSLAVIDKFQRLSDEGVLTPPKMRAYSSALGSISSSKSGVSIEVAATFFETILQKIDKGDLTGRLTSKSQTLFFRSILRSHEEKAEETALKMLRKTVDIARKHPLSIQLDNLVFKNILSDLAGRQLQDDVWEVFDLAKTLTKEGFDVAPDKMVYTSVATALSSQKPPPSTLERIDALNSEVFRLYQSQDLDVDMQLFNAILEAYRNAVSSNEEAAQRAYDLLAHLEDLSQSDDRIVPDIVSYRRVCQAFSKIKAPSPSAMNENVFLRAKARAMEGRIPQLDIGFYRAMITSYARDADPASLKKAEALLAEMRDSGNENLSPDAHIYNHMLSAYSHSDFQDKAARAAKLLKDMKQSFDAGNQNCRPSVHSFNSVIRCAAKTDLESGATLEVFEIAVENFKALHSQDELPNPNSYTYEFFIRACLRHLPDGDVQTKLVTQAFNICRDKGLVTPPIVKLVHCVIPDLLGDLEKVQASSFATMADRGSSPAKNHDVELIPESWCSRVPEITRKRKVDLGDCHLHP